MIIENLHHHDLHINQFVTTPGQAWCVFGENCSGIAAFIKLLSGTLTDYRADHLQLPEQAGILSFTAQQELFEQELRNDDSDFLNKADPGTLVREFLPNFKEHLGLLQTFGLAGCLDLGYRQLSSGQARKLLLLCELIKGATTLVLENPFDGLDEASCREISHCLMHLPERGLELVICVNNRGDIPPWASHLAIFKDGKLFASGTIDKTLPQIAIFTPDADADKNIPATFLETTGSKDLAEELVSLHNGFAGYGGKMLFSGLDLLIKTGDHSLITGPNGCGKSTLLDIITGDNPKCYANELRIFGQKRGSGESIWALKKHMGIVSPALHRDHRIPGSSLQVVLSGLYDSIGLYKRATAAEIQTARQWLAWIDLSGKATTPFRSLTFSEQRLVLIARALIKRPKLLILDEPTQGLDDDNRNALLSLLEYIAAGNLSTILFVSHRRDEHRPFFKQQIHLDAHAA